MKKPIAIQRTSLPLCTSLVATAPYSLMKLKFFVLLSLVLTAAPATQAANNKPSPLAAWERSIVTVEVARKQYDYYQPWSKRTHKTQKTGTVISDREILTTADEMYDRTLVRLQKNGRGQWYIGEVSWIDYQANLALVTVADAD